MPLKLPVLNDKLTYAQWKLSFEAFAVVCKFDEALEQDFDQKLPSNSKVDLDETKDAEKKQIKARRKNAIAVAQLALALTRAEDKAKLLLTISKEWPQGVACKVMEALAEEYQPDDMQASVDRKRAIKGIKMRKGENPNTIKEQVARINNEYMGRLQAIKEEEEIAIILEAAPAKYASTLVQEKRIKKTNLKPKDLYDAMKDYYRTAIDEKDKEDEDEDEEEEESEVLMAGLNKLMSKKQAKEVMDFMAQMKDN